MRQVDRTDLVDKGFDMLWRFITLVLLGNAALFATHACGADVPPAFRFSRDILPIFAENCFQCHGPDENARKAKLRLDTQAGIQRVLKPLKSAESELIRRIHARVEDGGMPPASANRHLTAAQKELLRRWVNEGAAWNAHWAYESPVRPLLPAVADVNWPRNGIDHFIGARLAKERLRPSPEADRATLLRRVTLDLTGLPPTLRELDAFLADRSANAYETAVDQLLASSRYGERMTLDWLDDARYADTNGFQNDFSRTMWPWRDWVIDAFNRNQRFDRFLVEQLAGDLLPSATLSQRIATGFNRNNRTVTEAGSIDEEWRVENAVDRVETTATVFLGLTMGCCRCHDHKFDPISQKEFYQFYAFFNSVNEKGVYTETRGNVAPLIALPTKVDEERLRKFDAEIAAAQKTVSQKEATLVERQRTWELEQAKIPLAAEPRDWAFRCSLNGDLRIQAADGKTSDAVFRGKKPPVWSEMSQGKSLRLDGQDDSFVDAGQAVRLERTDRFSYGAWFRPAGAGTILSKMDDNAAYRGFDLLFNNDKLEVHLVNAWDDNAIKVATKETLPKNIWTHVFACYDGSSKAAGITIYINGRPAAVSVENDRLRDTITTNQPLRLGKRSTAFALNGELADVRIYRRTLAADEVQAIALQPLAQILNVPADKRTKPQQVFVSQFARGSLGDELARAKEKVAKLRKDKADYERKIPTVMVMEDQKPPRETFVLKRGRYELPDKSQKVEPRVPACLPPFPPDAPRNRLGLANWLVSPDHPLTARVTVNRFWQHYFGTGLVKTAENFGLQSEPPSHPELLDWLATEFVRSDWDVKAMQRLIVTSATYRQSSKINPMLVQHDPENRLLSRGPRFRLAAEVVRDNALAVSGLLFEKVGGPPIKPYQPAGLWEELAGGAGEDPYVQDKGQSLYRRSLYVYRKRTVPHPAMTTFDASTRETCQVKQTRTNTPLQALELLNDVTYVEAARNLGQMMLIEGGKTPDDRIAFAIRRATARIPNAEELSRLARGFERYRHRFASDPEAAKQFLGHGDSTADARFAPAELAAYAATAAVILNLDETITKE
jgi:Protein of unknown function (DUF1553)/Protein of unknown function (DUF1549)/Concanavalin A-like lectin/glucanases superfamily/Planctomycete cytochrome C